MSPFSVVLFTFLSFCATFAHGEVETASLSEVPPTPNPHEALEGLHQAAAAMSAFAKLFSPPVADEDEGQFSDVPTQSLSLSSSRRRTPQCSVEALRKEGPANGCGPDIDYEKFPHLNAMKVRVDALFKPACDRHDYCYTFGAFMYGRAKSECDSSFREEMMGICEKKYPKGGSAAQETPRHDMFQNMAGVKSIVEGVMRGDEAAEGMLGLAMLTMGPAMMDELDKSLATHDGCVKIANVRNHPPVSTSG